MTSQDKSSEPDALPPCDQSTLEHHKGKYKAKVREMEIVADQMYEVFHTMKRQTGWPDKKVKNTPPYPSLEREHAELAEELSTLYDEFSAYLETCDPDI